MALRHLCDPKAVLLDLQPKNKEDAIGQLVDVLASAQLIDPKKAATIRKEVLAREQQASTGIGRGIGVPHTRSAHVDRIVMGVGLVRDGMDFGAVDGEAVKVVLLLVSPHDSADDHLAAMRAIVSVVRDPYNAKRLQGCRSAQSFLDLFEEFDAQKAR